MRNLLVTEVAIACAVSLVAQTAPQKVPKKGDTVIVRGCLRGNSVEQADLMVEESEGETRRNEQVPVLTYRLEGDKSVRAESAPKDKHDRMVVQVKGVLRSELTRSAMVNVGRTRITIGADPRNPSQGVDQPLPVLDARSFEPTTVSCK